LKAKILIAIKIWLMDRRNGHHGGNGTLWYWAVVSFTVMCLTVKRVYMEGDVLPLRGFC